MTRRNSLVARVPSWFPALYVYATLVALNTALSAAFVNSDFWVRLASGRLVVREHIIPRHDPFTFTVRGHAWIDHEWLLGAAMYVLNSVNFELLAVVASVLAILPFVVMHRLAARDREDDWLLLALVAFSAIVAWRTYAIRPQLVNPLMFALLIVLIDNQRRDRSRAIWLAVPLTLVWANLQAGFLVAPAVLAAWCGVCVLERRDRVLSLVVLAASAMVPLVNAYGIDLYRYALSASLSGNTDRQLVTEWRSPNFHDALNLPALAGVLLLAHFGTRGGDRFRQVLAVGTLAASLVSARFVPFFALTLVYAIAPGLPAIRLPRLGALLAAAAAPTLAALSVLAAAATVASSPPLDREPIGGLVYLQSHAPQARVYADQSWASYMTWSGWPTYFDTRTHQVFPEALIADYHKVEQSRGDWQGVLNQALGYRVRDDAA